jgi:hypothetical protein
MVSFGDNEFLMTTAPKRHVSGPDRVGLCASCRWAEVVTSSKGSTFYLCTRSTKDPTFPKYPQLPVRVCRGYEATG